MADNIQLKNISIIDQTKTALIIKNIGYQVFLQANLRQSQVLRNVWGAETRAATEEDMLPSSHNRTAFERTCSTSGLPEYTGWAKTIEIGSPYNNQALCHEGLFRQPAEIALRSQV